MERTQDLKSRLDFLLFLPPLIIHRNNIFFSLWLQVLQIQWSNMMQLATQVNMKNVCDANVLLSSFVNIQDQLNKIHEQFCQSKQWVQEVTNVQNVLKQNMVLLQGFLFCCFISLNSQHNPLLWMTPTLNKIFAILSYLRLCIVCIYLRDTKEERERGLLETLIPIGVLAPRFSYNIIIIHVSFLKKIKTAFKSFCLLRSVNCPGIECCFRLSF